ncbi:BTAD domain-containing putative transcriptional regulator [Nocardia niigatensis]
MLIAVAGLAPGAGASTTALAVAALWPGPERVIMLEADPRGGSLADRCGGDPERGLASLTAAAGETGILTATDLEAHLQRHPSGISYLAAPTAPDHVAEALTRPISCDRALARESVVIADCGLAHADSAAAPLLAHADLLLLVARTDDLTALRTVGELATRYARAAVVLVGDPRPAPANLDAEVLGFLPCDESAAAALLDGRIPLQRNSVAAASALATLVHARVVPPVDRTWTPWRREGRSRFARDHMPRVYAINYAPPGRTELRPVTHRSHPPVPVPTYAPQPTVLVAESPSCSEPLIAQSDTVLAPCATLLRESADPAPMVTVALFGPLGVTWRASSAAAGQPPSGTEVTVALQRRSRELLALLALHPAGLTRAQLIDTLWGQRCPHRPTNALHTALGRIRTAFADASGGTAGQILLSDSGRYRLDSSRVTVDYTAFTDALASHRRAVTEADRRSACERIVGLAAAGTLAADLEADWLEPIRQHARREALAAVGALAQILVINDPRATLHLLSTAVGIDPHNEHLYRDMMRLHARLGEHHAIANTMALLTRRLADIGEKPSRETRDIAHQLHPTHTRIRTTRKK